MLLVRLCCWAQWQADLGRKISPWEGSANLTNWLCCGAEGVQLWCWEEAPGWSSRGRGSSPSNLLVSLNKSFSLFRVEFWIIAKLPRPGPTCLVGCFMTISWEVWRGWNRAGTMNVSYHFCHWFYFDFLCVGEPNLFNRELVRFLVFRCSKSLLSSDAFYFPL